MNIEEYGKWSPYNNDNPKYSGDEYNRSFIKERFECPDEYEGSDFDEYYSVPKMSDSFNFQKKKKEQSGTKSKSKNRFRQNMISRVVVLAAGSVIVTATYQANVNSAPVPTPDAVVSEAGYTQDSEQTETETLTVSTNWKWSEDNNTVVLEISDENGNLIKEVPADISVSVKEATCTKEGIKTYTAKVEDEDNTYLDSRSEILSPLGHTFSEGEEIVTESGQTATKFECDRCHEEFVISISAEEN